MTKKTEQKRLLDIVLEKLEDEKFLAKFKNADEVHKAIHDAVGEVLSEGHEIAFSQKDLKALASLDAAKYSQIHEAKEVPVFGFVFFGPVPEDKKDSKESDEKKKK